MGPDLEIKGRLDAVMEAAPNKDGGNVVKEPEDGDTRCGNIVEDTFEMGTSVGEEFEETHKREGVEINIVECMNSGDGVLPQAHSQDVTESSSSSSSFGNTLSEAENGGFVSDAEVVSDLHGDAASVLEFGGTGDLFRMRKKRLTSHWRTFIQPILWRCKWIELQIKKCQSQAIKYDAVLAENNRRKQVKLDNFALEGLGAKSLPFSTASQREKVMKRKKRKRAEDSIDAATYMSTHNLFSYYASRRSFADAASIEDWDNLGKKTNDDGELGVPEELLSLGFRDDDNSLEQILWKIGIAQSQVTELKTRLNSVMSQNAGKFSSTNNLSLRAQSDALTSFAFKSASPPNNNDKMPAGSSSIVAQLMPDYHMSNQVLPESAASSHRETTHLPDVIESTNLPHDGASREGGVDGMLIYNRRLKKVPSDFEQVKVHPMENLQVPKEVHNARTSPVLVPEDLLTVDQPTPKMRSISKLTAPANKRKRAKRKAGPSKCSRRSSG